MLNIEVLFTSMFNIFLLPNFGVQNFIIQYSNLKYGN